MRLTTFSDLITHTIVYLGKDASSATAADVRECVLDAYAELATVHNWNYYKKLLRINSVEPYRTGTVTYDHSGGTFERLLTLTGGVWPEWSTFGSITIGDVTYDVQERKSDTQVTLTENANPGTDISTASAFLIFRERYPLPDDFITILDGFYTTGFEGIPYQYPQDFARGRSRTTPSPARPAIYTVMGDPNLYSTMCIAFWPAPDQIYPFDFLYRSRGRELFFAEYKEGTVTATVGSTTINGNGTTFTPDMVGSVIRLSSSSRSQEVTGPEGLDPYRIERTIIEFISATSLRIDVASTVNLSAVRYIISDPVDIEPNAMLRALKRMCEKQARFKVRMAATAEEAASMRMNNQMLTEALRSAAEADARYTGLRIASTPVARRRRLREYPIDLSTQ
jgi:hypothetical protein